MSTVTQPLKDEHRDLFPHVELLRTVGDLVGEVPPDSLLKGVDETLDFLTRHLLPHATAEDEALYPVVNRLMGAPGVTATMSREHAEVAALAKDLALLQKRLHRGVFAAGDEKDLRRVLYGLHAIVKLHFAKEEEIYLPLLEARLSPDDAERMFLAMEAVAAEARAASPRA
jgi:hemerythrin-like domain-containing protein